MRQINAPFTPAITSLFLQFDKCARSERISGYKTYVIMSKNAPNKEIAGRENNEVVYS